MAKPESDELQARRDNDGLHKRRGVWYYCLTVAGKRRFFSTKTKSYQEARRIRAEAVKAQLEHRLPNDLARWPFEKLLAKVLENRTAHLAENSVRTEKERSVPVLKHFAGKRVNEITADAIRDYQVKRTKLVSGRTVNLETRLIRYTLKAAKIWATVEDDFKLLPENKGEIGRALDEAQERLLFATAQSNPDWHVAFLCALTAANTTMRSVELRHLQLQHVNLVDGEVAVQRSKGNTAGIRRIPLNPAARWGLARLLERANALGSVEPNHYLLPFDSSHSKREKGAGYDPARPAKGWRTAWRRLIKEATRRATAEGIDSTAFVNLRFHDLRHCAITKLSEGQASDQTIMSIAGHMSRQMLEHYSHTRAAAKRKAVEAMKSAFELPDAAATPLPATDKVQ